MVLRFPHRTSVGLRYLSSTACLHKNYVSNVGKQLIKLPHTVTLTPSSTALSIEGPMGKTSVPLEPFIQLKFLEDNALEVGVDTPSVKEQRSMWGTTRTLIYNAIVGMTVGYSVPLYLVGVGYRVALEEDTRGNNTAAGWRLNMKLGSSHSILVPIPSHIKVEVPIPTKIILSCN